MGEIVFTTNPNVGKEEHPLLMRDIAPLFMGVRTHWGEHVGEVSIYISGSKTDWLNQGCVRLHPIIPLGSTNADLRAARALVKLHATYPCKFHMWVEKVFPSWRAGSAIQGRALTALLRSAVFKRGLNPGAYSLHSLRAGGESIISDHT